MNNNAIIAILVVKDIITQEEGEKLVELLHDKPQSTVLNDSIAQIKEFVVTETSKNNLKNKSFEK